jgi:hypothetical protein
MATGCTIPCDIGGIEGRIRSRAMQDALAPNVPVLGAGVLLLLASPVVIPFGGWRTALIMALFFAAGVVVIVGRAYLETGPSVKTGVPSELEAIVEANAGRIFPARLPEFRARAARLTYDSADYRRRVTEFLEDLRMTTGEVLRCPCRKRRLPIPLPF